MKIDKVKIPKRIMIFLILLPALLLMADCHLLVSEFGPKVVYVAGTSGEDIWFTRAGSSIRKKFTASGATDINPVISPDGSRIAWIGGSVSSLWVMSNDGSHKKSLTPVSYLETYPCWSPDGSRIVFDNDYDIYYVEVDGGIIQDVYVDSSTGGAFDREPQWSPDGSTIAFLHTTNGGSTYDLMLYRPGGGLTTVTDNAARMSGNVNLDFSWSPDGSQIAYMADLNANPAAPHYQIHVVAAKPNANPVNISNSSTQDFNPVWSPSGQRIMFVRNAASLTDVICIMNSDGSHLVQLSDNGTYSFHPQWSPDGRQIIFDYDDGGGSDIAIVNCDGSGLRKVTTDGNANRQPSWSFRSPG
jgi:Tol biopolymer transport system component